MRYAVRLSAALGILARAACPAYATEGGNSHADFGYIDTLAGIIPPPGFYFRNDLNFTGSNEFDDRSGNPVTLHIGGHDIPIKFRASSEVDIVSAAYVPDAKIPYINASFGFAAYELFANTRAGLTDSLGAPEFAGNDVVAAGDMTIVPLFVGTTRAPFSVLVAPFDVTAPTGRYSASSVNNLGLNYWSYRLALLFTYLNKTGQEVDFNASLSINSQNQATHYKSGNEFYLGYAFQQYLSRKIGLEFGGYYYKQISDDTQFGQVVDTGLSPATADLENFGPGNVGETFAFGPVFSWNFSKNIFFQAHWDHELFSYDRQKRDLVFVRATFRF